MYRYDFTPTVEEKSAVLRMFSRDLVIPNNFISIEHYKTKTNPQTTQFCDKLCVDDSLALLLGKWTRLSLSQNDSEPDSTFSSFIDSTICSNNEDELIAESTYKKKSMPTLVLPEPKNETNKNTTDIVITNMDEDSLLNITYSSITSNTSTEILLSESNNKNSQSEGK